MKLTEDHRKLLKAATLYYKEGLTQAEIGRRLGVSRPVVSKWLQLARESGVVTIYLKDESAHTTALAIALEKKYGLKEAIVVATDNLHSPEAVRQAVARQSAIYLEQKLASLKSIGLSWGTTLAAVIDEMPYVSYPALQVVPLVGGVASEHLYFDTNHLVFRLAEKVGGRCRYLYAPALAESEQVATTLLQTALLKEALQAAKNVDLAVIGVGNPLVSSTWRRLGYMGPAAVAEMQQTGVVGDAVASLFDKSGFTVDNSITRKMIGLTVEELSCLPETLLIADDQVKVDSVKPLLTHQRCNLLITDQALSEALLADEDC